LQAASVHAALTDLNTPADHDGDERSIANIGITLVLCTTTRRHRRRHHIDDAADGKQHTADKY
jgi:hypothetical protein